MSDEKKTATGLGGPPATSSECMLNDLAQRGIVAFGPT
jgi:hypothetical protein